MKIVFLHYTLGLINRGSEISTQLLASFLSKQNKVQVYQSGNDFSTKNLDIIKVKLPLSPRFNKNLSLLGKLLERCYLDYNSLIVLLFSFKTCLKLIKTKPEIIIPTNGFWQIIICKLVKVFTHSKIVVIGRSGIGWTDKDNLRLKPDLFIGLTEKAQSWALKICPRVKSIYLPNAINTRQFSTSLTKTTIPLKRPIILTVAALTSYKNIDKLIVACGKLKNVSLLIVGQGELHNKLNLMAQQYLRNRYLIRTYSQKEMPSVYGSCNLFVLLSDEKEAFGRVFLEAMASGLQVLTITDDSRKKIIGDGGVYLKSLDTPTIVKGIIHSLKVNNTYTLKKQAESFDINIIGPKYEKALLNL